MDAGYFAFDPATGLLRSTRFMDKQFPKEFELVIECRDFDGLAARILVAIPV